MAQVIPKVVHRFWLGTDPIPERFERYAESWQRHHPEWEMRLWTDDTLPELSVQDLVDASPDFRTRYDVIRLELLRQLGGVIIDMDMEAIRPLDPLLDDVEAFVARVTRGPRIGVQVLGAVPHHPFFERAVVTLRDTVGVAPTPSQEAGPGFITRLVLEGADGVTILPRQAFYSALTIEPPRQPEKFPEIYAVHHHVESYRGPQAEAEILGRRLHETQLELHRVEQELEQSTVRKDKDEAKLRRRLERSEARLETVSRSRWWRLGKRLGVVRE